MPTKLTPELNDMQLKENIDSLVKQGAAHEQVQGYINNYTKGPAGNYVLKQAPKPTAPSTDFGDRVADAQKTGIKNTISSVMEGAKKVEQGMAEAPGSGKGVAQVVRGAGEAALGATSGAIETAGAPITAAVGAIADKASDLSWVQKLADTGFGAALEKGTDSFHEWAAQHPELSKNLGDAANVGLAALGSRTAPKSGVMDTAKTVVSDVKKGVDTVKESLPKSPTPEEISQQSIERRISEEAAKVAEDASKIKKAGEEWLKPTLPGKSKNPAGFNNARTILKKNPEVGQVLAENKLHPQDHITETGHYATEESANNLVKEAGMRSNKYLRPALEAADPATPLTPVEEVFSSAISRLQRSIKGDPAVKEEIEKSILGDFRAFKSAYPEGMKLSDLHDEKIRTSESAGYDNPFKSASDTNRATAKRTLSSALGKMVEQKAPEDLPVDAFNQELQKMYEAADYLKSINNKKAPESLTQVIANRGSSVIGAALGHHVGGGILGGVGGYVAGGVLEKMVANMLPKYQAEVLAGLRQSDPPAFTRVTDYIRKVADERANGLKLGAPDPTKSTINQGRPIYAMDPNAKGHEFLGKDIHIGDYVPPNKAPGGKAKMPPFGEYDETYIPDKELPVIKFGNKPPKK